MAKSRCVAAQCEVKDVFDKSVKPAVLKQMQKTIQAQVEKKKSKGLVYDDKCKDGWLLKATVVSLKLNDASQVSLEVKASIDGVPLFGTANGFKSKGSAKVSGINKKKLDKEAAFVVESALESLMAKQAIPHMLKA